MKRIPTPFSELLLLEPQTFVDERGAFVEIYRKAQFEAFGVSLAFVQDNLSRSNAGVLRGLHYQFPHPQGKLVTVIRGQVLDVAVDIRLGSPTFGKSFSFILDDVTRRQAYIPPGFAHGFYTLTDRVDFLYKCTAYYHAEGDRGVAWNDPHLAIAWPTETPTLSSKDREHLPLHLIPTSNLPIYEMDSRPREGVGRESI